MRRRSLVSRLSFGPRVLLVPLAVLGLVAGCSDGDGDSDAAGDERPGTSTTSTTDDTASSTTSTTAPTTSTTAFEGGTTPTSLAGDAAEVSHLVDVRAAHQDGFDRVVFEFDSEGVPNVAAELVEQARADGSGRVVEVEGEALLQIRMEPARTAEFTADGYRLTYEGPDRVRGDTETVTEVVLTGDFEANLTWVLGLREQVPYRVTTLRSPARVVVEVAA